MAQRHQRGWLKKEKRAQGETWVLFFRTTRQSDGKRVENKVPVGLVRHFPDLRGLLSIQPVENHPNDKRVVRLYVGLLAPMIVEELFAVEAHELAEKATIGVVRRGPDREDSTTEEPGKPAQTQSHFTHGAKATTPAAF